MSPSPEDWVNSEPSAGTIPATPLGDNFDVICRNQAQFA